MSQNNPPYADAAKLANVVGQIGCVTSFVSLVIIGISFGIGRFLDNLLGTGGILTVVLLLGSFPITMYAIVKVSILLLSRAQQETPGSEAGALPKSDTLPESTDEEEKER